MAIPNLHTQCHLRSRRELLAMIVAYRLPILIFTFAVALTVGYNAFFLAVLRGVDHYTTATVDLAGAPTTHHARVFWLTYSTTWGFAVAALAVGNVLFSLMFASFLRAVFTSAGYVPSEPWRWPPSADPERQSTLQESWARQQQWLREQETRAQEQTAHAHQVRQQQQQMWWDMQLAYLQQQQQQQQLWESTRQGGAAPPVSVALDSTSGTQREPNALVIEQPVHASSIVASTQPNSVALVRHEGEPLATKPAVKDDSILRGRPDSEPAEERKDEAAALAHPLASTSSSAPSLSSSVDQSQSSCTCSSTSPSGASAADSATGFGGVQPSAAPSLCAPKPPAPPPAVLPAEDAPLNSTAVREFEADGSLRFCAACHQYKPDGSHHCRTCQRCVFDMDHHCLFLNNCVGRHNYKFFFLCIFYSTLCGSVNSALLLCAYLGSAVCGEWDHRWWWVPAGMGAIGVCVTYLWVQHVFLLVRGVSTLDRMSELASERFLAKLAGGPVAGHPRSGCLSDCWLTGRVCGGAVVHAYERMLSWWPTSSRKPSALARRAALPLLPESAALTMAQRRAKRVALLFGQPRHVWEYVLPVAPRTGACMSDEKARGHISVEAM